jgi:hypothetical protein
MKRVLVLGYYNRQNFGDDLFQYVFKKFALHQYDVTIANLDEVNNVVESLHAGDIAPFSAVIIGGGDLINDYYFNDESIALLRETFAGIPVIFYGVGLSFPDMLPVMDIGDYFFMRNKSDADAVKARYRPAYGGYTPDLAYFLINDTTLIPSQKQFSAPSSIQKIGICVPQTWFVDGSITKAFYDKLVSLFGTLAKTYELHFIPFDISGNKDNSDISLLNALQKSLSSVDAATPNRLFFHIPTANQSYDDWLTDMIHMFNSFDLVLASRFHSVKLCILTETPFVSLYSTRKVGLMQEEIPTIPQGCFIKAVLNNDGLPIDFDTECMMQSIHSLIGSSDISHTLHSVKKGLHAVVNKTADRVFQAIESGQKRIRPPQYIATSDKQQIIQNCVGNALTMIGKWSMRNQQAVLDHYPLSKIFSRRQQQSFGHVERALAEEIIFTITGDPYAPYYYGLCDTVLDTSLAKSLDWVIGDYYSRFHHNIGSSSQNLQVVNKNFQELHRSGWQYIVDNLVVELSNTNNEGKEPLIIDTYVDKTFHWNQEFYSRKGMLPYTKPWVGFIHHTFNSYNNTYNCDTLFKNPLFLQSLQQCRCLIVMSSYLKAQICEVLEKLQLSVPVEVVYHPSELTDITFDWDAFINLKKEDRQVVQVGNWLRNVFAIYKLELPTTSIVGKKSVLRNKNTDNYFPPDNFVESLLPVFNTKPEGFVNGVVDICKLSFENMHIKGLYEHVAEMENSVQNVSHLDNIAYDRLLSTSIVFVELIDASAVNTLIECILRNTPILVNRIQPVVEVLGEDYPLYYTSMYEASKKLDDAEALHAAHVYLKSLDKTPFLIETFMSRTRQVIQQNWKPVQQ